jgi:hypothetical protein
VLSLEARVLVPVIGISLFSIFLVITVIATAAGAVSVHSGAGSYWVALACFALAWYNTSTGWLAQLVTYPLFGCVPRDHFVEYHTQYDSLIPFPVILPAILLMNGSVFTGVVSSERNTARSRLGWHRSASLDCAFNRPSPGPCTRAVAKAWLQPTSPPQAYPVKLAPHCGHFRVCVALVLDCRQRC